MIETIVKKINLLYQNFDKPEGWVVVVLAPTGLAAYNVSGVTIHRFFKMPVQNKRGDKHWNLSGDNLKFIRGLTRSLKMIIIGKQPFFNK